MTLSFDDLLIFLIALVGLFSPFANIGPYASLVGHFPRSDQRKIAAGVFFNVVVVLLVFLATHFFSPAIAARLSPLGRQILNRIGGIILVAIAVQLLASGLKGLFPILAG